ncbi:single-stranded DNA-binding protein [Sphaerisporangium viridialbum]|uniref:single-stranded DNA-binding protein n=1 Tax=Sphaerisporangium viridialbum TaxID=46189 RepID=UPI003C743373
MSAENVRRSAMGGTMNDIYITLNGNVAADPRQYHFDDGTRVTSLRLASTRRVFDKASQSWHDGETTFYAVRCYRILAENVAQSIKLGQPIVVHGKLRIRSYERDGERRFLAEVEATSVGHDLRRGVSRFEKAQRGASTPAFDDLARERLASSTRDWELVGPISEADGSAAGASRFALTGSSTPGDADGSFAGPAAFDLTDGDPTGIQPSRDEHSRDEHSRDEHSRDEHSRDEHSRDEPSGGEHSGGEHSGGEHSRGEPLRDDPSRHEPLRDDPSRHEPLRDDPSRGEPSGGEPLRDEPLGDELRRGEPFRHEPLRGEPSREEAAGQGLALAGSDEAGLSVRGSAEDGGSRRARAKATRTKAGSDSVEDPAGSESWPEGEAARRLAA